MKIKYSRILRGRSNTSKVIIKTHRDLNITFYCGETVDWKRDCITLGSSLRTPEEIHTELQSYIGVFEGQLGIRVVLGDQFDALRVLIKEKKFPVINYRFIYVDNDRDYPFVIDADGRIESCAVEIFPVSASEFEEIVIMQYKENVFYKCLVGSRAYGLHSETSDFDIRGVYLLPKEAYYRLDFGVPETRGFSLQAHWSQDYPTDPTTNAPVIDQTWWELRHFLKLSLQGNPNILECWFTPLVEEERWPFEKNTREIIGPLCLSKQMYKPYMGYAKSQIHVFRKSQELVGDKAATKQLDWKALAHAHRLLIAFYNTMRTGRLEVTVEPELREFLLSVKEGQLPAERAMDVVEKMVKSCDQLFNSMWCRLQPEPDYAGVSAWYQEVMEKNE